jgi:hypothetical protein
MAFLIDEDYDLSIKAEILSKITGGDATLLSKAERAARSEVKKFMNVRFDATAELAKTGDARDPDLIRIMVDIAVYHLHKRLNPGQVPELRRDAYISAIDDLKMIANGKLLPDWKQPDGAETGTKFDLKYGGYERRDPYF